MIQTLLEFRQALLNLQLFCLAIWSQLEQAFLFWLFLPRHLGRNRRLNACREIDGHSKIAVNVSSGFSSRDVNKSASLNFKSGETEIMFVGVPQSRDRRLCELFRV